MDQIDTPDARRRDTYAASVRAAAGRLGRGDPCAGYVRGTVADPTGAPYRLEGGAGVARPQVAAAAVAQDGAEPQ